MSINLRTGQPGHGKSYGAVRVIRDSLESGRYVATNVPLAEGWALTMARTNWFRRLIPGRSAKVAARFESHLYQVDDLTHLRRLRLPACGTCPGCKKGKGCRREGRGRAVLDEAHKWLNARTWDADETGQGSTKAEAVKRRLDIVRFFSTHRHFGWDVELITQDEQNLDRQVRSLFETHTHMKNLRRFKLLGLVPVVPVNLFVAVTHWHDNDKTRLGVESFLLNRKLAGCYDTFGAAREVENDPDAIWLGATSAPRPPDRPRAEPPGGRPSVDSVSPPSSEPAALPSPAWRPRKVSDPPGRLRAVVDDSPAPESETATADTVTVPDISRGCGALDASTE